jgi:DNA-binding NarL/FixJ family response regulator
MSIRILIADDHPMYRHGVRSLLEHTEGLEVVGEATTGEEAVRLAHTLKPDVIMMDIRMPGIHGIEATRQIKAVHHDIQILMVTMFQDDASMLTALKAGARGYILKDAGKDVIIRALHAVSGGEAIFSPEIASKMIGYATRPDSGLDAFPQLTLREKEVLSLMANDASNAEIARQLMLSSKTVSNYIANILNKLKVPDRLDAIQLVKENRMTLGAARDPLE